jgi:hypothetical protein
MHVRMPRRTVIPAAVLAVALAACSSTAATPSAAPSPTPSSTPSAVPSVVASAAASALASAVASAAANPSPLPMSVKSLDKTVKAGQKAGITIDTKDGASCTIAVTYATGPSTAAGLEPAIAASNGYVSWGWTVESGTAPGTYPIDVVCKAGTLTGELHTEFTVK